MFKTDSTIVNEYRGDKKASNAALVESLKIHSEQRNRLCKMLCNHVWQKRIHMRKLNYTASREIV